LAQFARFLSDWAPEYEATEAVCANLSVGYAGTLDAIAKIPALGDGLLVLDYKTGKTGPYPEWALQVAAYHEAEWLWLKSGERVAMPAVAGAAVLRLRPEYYALHILESDVREVFPAFCAAAQLAGWVLDADPQHGTSAWSVPLPTPALDVTSEPA